MSNRVSQRMKDDEGWGEFFTIMGLSGVIFFLSMFLMGDEIKERISREKKMPKNGNLYIINYLDENNSKITIDKAGDFNWDKRIHLTDQNVQISCKISNQKAQKTLSEK